jgi:hypothetical protein
LGVAAGVFTNPESASPLFVKLQNGQRTAPDLNNTDITTELEVFVYGKENDTEAVCVYPAVAGVHRRFLFLSDYYFLHVLPL